MKKKKIIAIIVLIIAISLLIAGGILIFQNYSNKEKITSSFTSLKSSLEKTFNLNNDEIKTIKETGTGSAKITINPLLANMSSSTSYYTTINNLNNSIFNYEYRIDTEAKKMYFDGSLLLNMQEMLGINFYQNENISYVFLRNIFDKYITVEDNDIFSYLENTNKSKEDIDYIYNLMIESIKNNITSNDIKVSSEKIDNENTKKISLALTNERFEELSKAIIKDLKNDKKAKSIVGDFITEMETTIKNNSTTTNQNTKMDINYNIYLNKNNIVRYELEMKDNSSKATIRYNDNKTKSIEILENDNVIGNATITNENNNINIALTYNNANIGTIIINDKEVSLDIKVVNQTNDSVNIKYNSKKENSNINTTFNISMTSSGTEINIINITDTRVITANTADFSNINTTNNININSLNETDITTIENNLMTILYSYLGMSI